LCSLVPNVRCLSLPCCRPCNLLSPPLARPLPCSLVFPAVCYPLCLLPLPFGVCSLVFVGVHSLVFVGIRSFAFIGIRSLALSFVVLVPLSSAPPSPPTSSRSQAGWWCCDVVAVVLLLLLSRNRTRCHPASRGLQW
jgi:hypothetical protein